MVDFWAEWCGPCRQLTPALEAAARARDGKVDLVKVDTDANQQLSQAFGIQGIPAVKAFRDGQVVDEFVGAQPPAAVERFFDGLVPSESDALVEAGDETSLRRAIELEPARQRRRAARSARMLRERGEDDEALEVLGMSPGDFAAEGLAARIRLERDDRPRPRLRLRSARRGRPRARARPAYRRIAPVGRGARRRAPRGRRRCSTSSASTTRSRATRAGGSPRRCTESARLPTRRPARRRPCCGPPRAGSRAPAPPSARAAPRRTGGRRHRRSPAARRESGRRSGAR